MRRIEFLLVADVSDATLQRAIARHPTKLSGMDALAEFVQSKMPAGTRVRAVTTYREYDSAQEKRQQYRRGHPRAAERRAAHEAE